MGRSPEELQAGLDDDFKKVIEELQGLFVYLAKKFRGRATHTYGTAATGRARIIAPFEFPDHELFRFGKEYAIVLRHATPGPPPPDNRTLDGAAVSIKFLTKDCSADGAHDILMNTGRILFVRSARAFNTMVHTPQQDAEKRKQLVATEIVLDDKLTEGYRTGSFTEFYYYSQICYEFNETHYLRYRIIPGDRGPERGRFPSEIRAEGRTTAERWPDDERSPDFLRQDFRTRVAHLSVRYLLQVQLRPMDVTKDPWANQTDVLDVTRERHEPDALDPSREWDERYYPWLDLALLHIDKNLSDEEADKLNFDANRTYSGINLPLATNPKYGIPHNQADRFASFGHSRALVYSWARTARAESPQPHAN